MIKIKDSIYEFIATGGYSGYSPFAPGTFGTIMAMLLYIIYGIFAKDSIFIFQPGTVALFLSIILLYPSVRISGWMEKKIDAEDPGCIVIDEVLGYWVTVALLPFNWQTIALGFIFFRILDIVKPYPAYTSQNLPNGWGVVLDDIIAGIYGNILLRIVL